MRERRRQLGDVAVIGLRLRCCVIAHDEFVTKAASEPSCTMAEFASKVDLIVEIVLERRLGHDWLDRRPSIDLPAYCVRTALILILRPLHSSLSPNASTSVSKLVRMLISAACVSMVGRLCSAS